MPRVAILTLHKKPGELEADKWDYQLRHKNLILQLFYFHVINAITRVREGITH